MLVLSRKKNETFKFPNLGVSIEILRVKGNNVQVGIDAPREIRVLRGELVDEQDLQKLEQSDREHRHDLRNQLNTANLALHMMQKQLDAGNIDQAEKMLEQAVKCFETLDTMVTRPVAGDIPAAKSTDSSNPENKQACRALVVEDNANERQLLAGFLEMHGYKVDSVPDGKAAMQYLNEQAEQHALPDLVLMDMHMPRMDGPSTIAAIRKNPQYKNMKLFVVSGSDKAEMSIPSGDRGVDHWFAKPIKPAKFVKDLTSEMSRECSLN